LITALVSKKGGVGRTTTAVSLAAALADADKRVLLVDLDTQASASLSLGVHRSYLAPSVADVLLRSLPVAQALRSTQTRNLMLLTASADLASVDNDLQALPHKERRLRSALEPVRGEFDFIVLDCPPVLSLLGLNALVAADNYIIPVLPHYLSLAGIDGLTAAAERLRQRYDAHPELLGILLTQVDYRARANRDKVAMTRARYGATVFAAEIPTNISLAEAPEKGQTIFELDAGSAGAKAYRLLANEVLIRANAQLASQEAQESEQKKKRPSAVAPAGTTSDRALPLSARPFLLR
jgi:chromosome partitioning protein